MVFILTWSVNFIRCFVVALDNWLRELRTWCPALEVLLYYGSQEERRGIRTDLLDGKMDDFQILLTTSVILIYCILIILHFDQIFIVVHMTEPFFDLCFNVSLFCHFLYSTYVPNCLLYIFLCNISLASERTSDL